MSHKKDSYDFDDDEDYVPTKRVKYSEKDDIVLTEKKKHTLDSDEDDENDEAQNYNLKDEDIDGQEKATIDFEGETKITPFNMEEEMEEGYFDQDGFYQFKKDATQLKDAWMDNIDWQKVKKKGEDLLVAENDDNSDSESESELPTGNEEKELIALYEKIITHLKEGETIAKALQRLGKKPNRISSADRWKNKKLGICTKSDEAERAGNMADFMTLTELSNAVMATGNMDIYEETYEMVSLKIQKSEAVKTAAPAFDMFGDAEPLGSSSTNKVNSPAKDTTFEDVSWEYKTNDNEAISGPISTEEMIKLQDKGDFKDGSTFVRKIGKNDAQWYKGNRMDFSIYI